MFIWIACSRIFNNCSLSSLFLCRLIFLKKNVWFVIIKLKQFVLRKNIPGILEPWNIHPKSQKNAFFWWFFFKNDPFQAPDWPFTSPSLGPRAVLNEEKRITPLVEGSASRQTHPMWTYRRATQSHHPPRQGGSATPGPAPSQDPALQRAPNS